MQVSKDFTWEMSHRLPFHQGPCKNIHGHTYRLRISIDGLPTMNYMVIDFYDVDKIVKKYISNLDHSFICDSNDSLMIDFLNSNAFKLYIINDYTTCENITNYLLDLLSVEFFKFDNIHKITIRIYETSDTFSENFREKQFELS